MKKYVMFLIFILLTVFFLSLIEVKGKEPVRTKKRWGDDVEVSCYDWYGTLNLFDADNSTGSLFSLIQTFYNIEGFMYLSVSLDTGKTWIYKYSWSYAMSGPTNMGGVVMGDYFYTVVAWRFGETIQRFYTSNGIYDSIYGDSAAVVIRWDEIDEIWISNRELASSQAGSTHRLYYYCICADSLLFYWSEDSGKTWASDNPGIKNISGYDVCGNDGGLSEETWCCYRSQSDSLYAASRSDSGWTYYGPFDYGIGGRSIDAYKDTVIIVYKSSNCIKYVVSYNGGSDWVPGVLYGPSAAIGNITDVTAGDGYGFGAVYTAGGEGFYTHKNPFDLLWSEPVSFADTGYSVSRAKVEQIVGGLYGIVYQGGGVKFDRSDWVSGIEEEPVAGSDLFMISANPSVFSSRTSIEYFLPVQQGISLDIYDILGNQVINLVSGEVPTGENVAVWDGKDASGNTVSSGTYFCVLKSSDDRSVSRKITLIK